MDSLPASHFPVQLDLDLALTLICDFQLCRVATTSRAQLTKQENELIFLQERLDKLALKPPTHTDWLDFSEGFQSMMQLRSEITVERGQAVLECEPHALCAI